MTPTSDLRRAVPLALVALGAVSQVAQAILSRELLVAFHGNEVSLGAFYGSWLLAIGAGGYAVAQLRRRGRLLQPATVFRWCVLMLPLLLAAQLLAARFVRALLDVPSAELVPLGQLGLATLLLTLPTGLAVGLAFPLACELLASARQSTQPVDDARDDVRDVSWLYVVEAAGALAGGVLFTFVFVEYLGAWRTVGLTAVVLAGAAWTTGRRSRLASGSALALAVAGLLVALTPVGALLHTWTEEVRFGTQHPGLSLIDSVETRYGHVAVGRLQDQVSVAVDGHIAASFPNPAEVAQQAAYFHAQSDGARRVLVLGGVASGLPAELLRYPVERVAVVEDDREAFARLRPHLDPESARALDDPRLSLHFGDGRRFVNGLPADARYGLVLVLTPDPASAHLNRMFTRDFYRSVRSAMRPDGVLCTAVSSATNYLGRDVQSYSGSVLRTLSDIFQHVAIAPGDRHVFCASSAPGRVTTDPDVLARRYAATPLTERTFPAEGFASLLEPERVAFVRQTLEQEEGELNTDLTPVTYFLNMLLWGKFTASAFTDWLHALRRMGPATWLLPLGIFCLLLIGRQLLEGQTRPRRRRSSSLLALAVLGFVAMAAQLTLLLSYQAHVGFVFGRIALLNGVFMTGLAIGAGFVGRRLAETARPGAALAAVLALVAVGCAALPPALAFVGALAPALTESAYLVLVTATGVLTGAGFPLGVRLAHGGDDVARTTGIVEAADHLGGAVGGLLAGAVLVPLLGVTGTAHLLALSAVFALVPVLLAERNASGRDGVLSEALRARGYRSFPFVRTTWLLLWLALSVWAVGQLARGAAPGPIVRFSDDVLAETSGSASFAFADDPMPHYTGTGEEPSLARTVSLASQPVAGDVRGYAGPLNLLVSVDEAGTLRAVRYLDSDETPSYIYEIDGWLEALSGRDLSDAPLDIEQVDVLTGATITSEAAIGSINRAARLGARAALGVSVAPPTRAQPSLVDALTSLKVLLVALLLLLCFPIFVSGHEYARLAYQVVVIAVFGFGFNCLLTEVDLLNISLGRLPSFVSNPTWYLVVGFVAVTSLLWGQVYCGFVCPFGAVQELLSRLGRALSLRAYAGRFVEMRMRYAKFVVLAAALSAAWIADDVGLLAFNPMQHVFVGRLAGWIGLITVVSLLGSVVYYRFWCRYFCPLGAFLALTNKLAFVRRLAPVRRFNYCDLGVRDELDVDCIQCNRCVTGIDFGVRRKSADSRTVSRPE